jgi:hypothetical protein
MRCLLKFRLNEQLRITMSGGPWDGNRIRIQCARYCLIRWPSRLLDDN